MFNKLNIIYQLRSQSSPNQYYKKFLWPNTHPRELIKRPSNKNKSYHTKKAPIKLLNEEQTNPNFNVNLIDYVYHTSTYAKEYLQSHDLNNLIQKKSQNISLKIFSFTTQIFKLPFSCFQNKLCSPFLPFNRHVTRNRRTNKRSTPTIFHKTKHNKHIRTDKIVQRILGKWCENKRGPSSVYHIVGDGNCLFHAVSYAVSGSQEHHGILIRLAIAKMHNICRKFNQIPEESNKERGRK